MVNTLGYIMDKYKLDREQRSPIEIPNIGRVALAFLFAELGFKLGVEIGVRDGTYSAMLMKANRNLELYGVDPYEPHRGYRDIVRQSSFDGYLEAAHWKLDRFESYHFMREYSKEALSNFRDNSLDFVYIDGDHSFEEVTFDVSQWSKKVRPGGIVSGDDYFKHKGRAKIHVYQAVNGYTDAYGIKPWFVLGSKAMNPGEVRDHGRSWMWVKP